MYSASRILSQVNARGKANDKMTKRKIGAVCGTALLIVTAVAVVVASRSCRRPLPPPDVPVAALPAEVRVKAVERNPAAAPAALAAQTDFLI